jgi:hypothetical protein
MKLLHLLIQRYYFLLFLGLCSCSGCDIDRTEVSLRRANPDPQLIDLSIGKCLVNEIEADVSAKQKNKLTDLMSSKLEEIFNDSVVFLNTTPSSRFKEKIPFEISTDLLDTLRKTTSYTYLLNVRAVVPGMAIHRDQMNVDIIIFDLDTRNVIYNQSVLAYEFEPQREDNSGFTFWLGHSDYNLTKNALQDALRDLRRGVRKFNRTQGQ